MDKTIFVNGEPVDYYELINRLFRFYEKEDAPKLVLRLKRLPVRRLVKRLTRTEAIAHCAKNWMPEFSAMKWGASRRQAGRRWRTKGGGHERDKRYEPRYSAAV